MFLVQTSVRNWECNTLMQEIMTYGQKGKIKTAKTENLMLTKLNCKKKTWSQAKCKCDQTDDLCATENYTRESACID